MIPQCYPIPEEMRVDLGVTDIWIRPKDNIIKYSGKGLQTDVGRRIPGPRKGIAIPEMKTSVKEVR